MRAIPQVGPEEIPELLLGEEAKSGRGGPGQVRPPNRSGDPFDLLSRESEGIEGTDEGAHAGARQMSDPDPGSSKA